MNTGIAIACDHTGVILKDQILNYLNGQKYNVIDLGTDDKDKAVDYPDFATKLAAYLKNNSNDIGILICGSGIGISIAANRFTHIRAALCHNLTDATLARQHNDANVLVLGAKRAQADRITDMVDRFINTSFEGGRHLERVKKLDEVTQLADEQVDIMNNLKAEDPEIFAAIAQELKRQQDGIELIASENYASRAVLAAQGSIMTNKYAEGYPGKRYYGGCEYVDIAENLAIDRLKKLYNAAFANVQPHSGSQANQAAFFALLNPGDTILGMSLNSGGHLTHGFKVNLSGRWFNAVAYDVDPKTYLIDMQQVRKLAHEHKPKLIIAGGSAYPRIIDFAAFREIADEVGAYFMVDMAHFSGLVAGGTFPSPVQHAHVITSTTHKTLRGPRGGFILTNIEEIAKKINSSVFPGIQGGPLMHVIAAKAVAFKEALSPEFKRYARKVIENARVLSDTLIGRGYKILTEGTDCHLLLLDLRPQGLTGKDAQKSLERAGLTCNKNNIPFDTQSANVSSGIRLGSPACTTRGFGPNEFKQIGNFIADVLDGLQNNPDDNTVVEKAILEQVLSVCNKFHIYQTDK